MNSIVSIDRVWSTVAGSSIAQPQKKDYPDLSVFAHTEFRSMRQMK